MPQHPLIRALLAHARGADEIPHRPVLPPYLADADWKHLCECGYTWRSHGDAVWRDGAWQPLREQCVSCHAWVTGQQVTAGN